MSELFIVATPIGNLEDITFRAIRVLKEADVIYAEDTRTSGILLKHYNISAHLRSCNARNEKHRIPEILSNLEKGQNIAIITDAGTPGISDPSVRVVSAVRSENYKVTPIPGASAVITAISAAGLPSDSFLFYGFLPNKKGRQTALKYLNTVEHTLVLYESPHRVEKLLKEIQEHLGNRYVIIGRELTKKFEEFISGYIEDLLKNLENIKKKGEFVVLISDKKFIPKL